MIKIDLKSAQLPLLLNVSLFIGYIILLCASPESFAFTERSNYVLHSSAFFYLDFVCPFLSVCCILIQLGTTFEKKTYEFLCSLPQKTGVMKRWCFTVGVTILPTYLISLVMTCSLCGNELIAFPELFFLSGANLFFYSSASLLLMTLLRKSFYVFSIICGFMFVDLTVGDMFFFQYSTFINLSAQYGKESANNNRIFYFAAAGICIFISAILNNSKYFKIEALKFSQKHNQNPR